MTAFNGVHTTVILGGISKARDGESLPLTLISAMAISMSDPATMMASKAFHGSPK